MCFFRDFVCCEFPPHAGRGEEERGGFKLLGNNTVKVHVWRPPRTRKNHHYFWMGPS